MSTTPSVWTRKHRIGFVLGIVLAAINLIPTPTPDGETGPPTEILIAGAVVAVIAIIGIIVTWRSGRPAGTRLAVACLAITALLAMPAFFVDVPAGVKVAVAVYTVLVVVASVLMLAPAGDTAHRSNDLITS